MSDFGEGGAEGTAASWVGRDAELRMYRLNRRSPVEQSLFGEPDGWDDQDAFDHFWHILSSAEPVVRSYQGNERLWALGDVSRQETPAGEFVIGTLGFERLGSERDSTYDEVRRTWVTSAEERHISEVVPIIVDAETRLVGVVAHREFRPNTVSVVLTRILRDAEERARQYSATRWSVEPVESSQALYDWLARTPRVMVLTLVLRLPNPDAPESLDALMRALDEKAARERQEKWKAATDQGLTNLQHDEEVALHAEAARLSWGSVRAAGVDGAGRRTTYDTQRAQARTSVGVLADLGAGLVEQLVQAMEGFRDAWRVDR